MIALCPNPFRDAGLEITKQAKKILEDAGYETVVCPVFADESSDVLLADISYTKLKDAADSCSLVIVIGGDGTIISVVHELPDISTPILGINLGTKGFLASIERDELELLLRAASGDYKISRRMMLYVELVRDGEAVYTGHAFNDVVIHGYGDCIKLTAWCDGDKMTSFSGDGIILATPTGSTGYSMSAGGPIVEPTAKNIVLSPICAHALGARTFVLDASREIRVEAEKLHGRRAYLSVDGTPVQDLMHDDSIRVRADTNCIDMVDLETRSFYEMAFDKLT